MRGYFQDASCSLRILRKNRRYSAAIALTLALGIGVSTATFSVIYAVLLAPMPYPSPDQLVMVWSKCQGGSNSVSAADYLEWRRQSTVFQDLIAWTDDYYTFATLDQPERIVGRAETPGTNRMLGVSLFLGRDFLPEEGEVGKNREIILTYRLWNRLGGDRDIIGKQLTMNDAPYRVVGVMQPGRADRQPAELLVPLAFKPDQVNHDFRWLLVMGRLKPGVSIAKAQADMDVITHRLAEQYPQTNKSWSSSVESLHDNFFPKDKQRILWLLMGAVTLVLLIACANVANLVLVQGASRFHEVAVRVALGATRWNIFSQFLMESLALAGIGGALGIGVGWALIRVLVAMLPPTLLPSEAEITFQFPVLIFNVAATTISGMLCGCAPAWHVAQVNPAQTIREGAPTISASLRQRLHRILVVGEFATALTLLAGAGLAIHSFWNLTSVDLGIRTDHLLTFGLASPQEEPVQGTHIVSFYQEVLEAIESQHGVVRAEVGTGMPIEGGGFNMPFTIAGQSASDPSARPGAGFQMVSLEYYDTLGMQIVKGRHFTDQDTGSGTRVAIVNEIFVKRFLSGVDPLTQRVVVERLVPGQTKLGAAVEWQIVGVSRNFHNEGIRSDEVPQIDVPFAQSPWPHVALVVRTRGDPAAMAKTIAAAVHSVDRNAVLEQISTMDQIVDQLLVGDRFTSVLYGSFAIAALLLAAAGIYGVMAFAVLQRTQEIGVRIALGANQAQVLRLILEEGLVLAAIGLALGLVGAGLVGHVLRGLLYGIGTIDATAFSAVAIILFAGALIACYVPARRAARVNPIIALRHH
jgi:putative ABC transport system permease protein